MATGSGTGTPASAVTTYATLAKLKSQLEITDSTEDTLLTDILEAVSRFVENRTGRVFTTSSSTTRYFTAVRNTRCYLGDVVSVSAVLLDTDGDRTYETTLASTDYDLWPYNPQDGWPYTALVPAPLGSYLWPTHAKGLSVTGVFGWSAVPDPIERATLLQAGRLYKRRGAPFGWLGGGAEGQMVSVGDEDPDAMALLKPYMLRL